MKCKICKREAAVALKSHNAAFCESCYLTFFRRQLQRGIQSLRLLAPGDRVLVALSGGKDSLSLMLELHEQGYDAHGLFIDLAIPGSSETARKKVGDFCALHSIPLKIIDLAREGLDIPTVKKTLRRPVCSACGKIKRYFFNKAALDGGYAALATGHNLDDEVSRLFSNTLRWDADYLASQGPLLPAAKGLARKIKPLWRLSEYETANYAFLRGIDYHWGGCPYSAGASFSALKNLLNNLENAMPGRKLDFYQGFLTRGKSHFLNAETARRLSPCPRCGATTSVGDICGICRLREALKAT